VLTAFRLRETVEFLQELIDETQLELNVSVLTEDDFESLVLSDDSVLNWRGKFPYYLSEDSFHMGFRLSTDSTIDGAVLGVYVTTQGKLHILLMESFVRNRTNHPLTGRLTVFVIIAATFFVTQFPDSKGVYIVDPHKELIPHYERFGFELLDDGYALYATVEDLQSTQLLLMAELQQGG